MKRSELKAEIEAKIRFNEAINYFNKNIEYPLGVFMYTDVIRKSLKIAAGLKKKKL